jgi:serine protease Do
VRRAWTGIDVMGPENLAEWKSQGGALVSNVIPQGPADAGGVKKGDVLTRANNRVLRNYLDWEAVKLDLQVGDPVQLVVKRDGRDKQITLKSGDLPTTAAMKVTVLKDLELVTLTAQVKAERNVQSESGALIFSISKTLSQATGLVQGDVIVGMNRRRISTADEVREVVQGLSSRQPLRVFLERGGQIVYTDLELR